MAATKQHLVPVNEDKPGTEITTLFTRLGDDVAELFNTQLSLFKVEVKEKAQIFARGAVAMAVGALVTAIGLAMLNVAGALGVSMLFLRANFSPSASYALGCVVTGAFYLVIGAIVLAAMKSRLGKQQLVLSTTIRELRKDKEWLKNEL